MTRTRWVGLLAWLLFACGDDASPPTDAGADVNESPMACVDDDDCDDGVFCNGASRCGEAGVCVTTPVNCDDGIACTLDRCSEPSQACRHIAADADGDGHADVACADTEGTPLGDDCDDNDPLRFAGNVEVCDLDHRDEDCDPNTRGDRDQDGDGFEDALCCNRASAADNAALVCGDDCDDFKRNVNPLASEACDGLNNDCDDATDEGVQRALYVDADRDGHGASGQAPVMACAGAVGLSGFNDDCDDEDVTVHGAQVELCDGADNDCDETTDENPQSVPWYRDADGDGFGDVRDSLSNCAPQAERSLLGTDCDDTQAAINPRAAEACDGVDNDCNGRADHRIADNDFEDDDGDGAADDQCAGGSDCNDRDPNTADGAAEICDVLDNDCDGSTDENAPTTVWYVDADRDGFGNARLPASAACFPIPGRSPRPGDCDDLEPGAFPGAVEWCDDLLDNDCDRVTDEDCVRTPDAGSVDAGGMADASGADAARTDSGAGGVGGVMPADGGTSGSGGAGGSAGAAGGGGAPQDAGVDAGGDAGVEPWPEIACDETTALDGTAGMVNLTVADQAEGIAFCGVLGQRIAIEASRSGGGCATLRVVDIEDNVLLDRFGCGAFYEELTFPGSRPYRVTVSAPTVPQTATIRLWDVPELSPLDVIINGVPYVRPTAIGQTSRYRFDVLAGQRITLSSNGPGCRQVTVRDALRRVVASEFVCGNYMLDAHTALTDGVYELESDANGNAIGDHTFTGWVLEADAMPSAALDGNAVIPIAAPGNNGSVTFAASTGQRISITATNVGCMDVRVASPTDVTVAMEFVCGTWFSDVLTLSETGTFVLHINPNALQTGSSTVNFHLLAADTTVDVTLDGPAVPGTIAKPGNNLTYRFSATSGTRLSATVSGPGCNQMTLWSPANVSLATAFVCGPWFLDAFALTTSGTHTITVNPNGAQTGATSAQLYAIASDPIVAASFNGTAVPGTIAEPGNNLTYELMGNAGDRISLRVSGPGCNTITLFDMNLTSLASAFVCGEWFLEPFVLPATQTYAVRVDPNGSQVGATQLIGYQLTPDPMQAATINGGTVTAVTTGPGQNARFTFSATAGQQVNLQGSSVACTNYSLLNPMGTAVISNFACGPFNQSAFLIATTGTHTFVIDPNGVNIGTLTFTVSTP